MRTTVERPSIVSPAPLSKEFAEIKALYGEILTMGRTTLEKALTIGKILRQNKPKENYKKLAWYKQLATETGLQRSTARNYMRLDKYEKPVRAEMAKNPLLGIVDALLMCNRKEKKRQEQERLKKAKEEAEKLEWVNKALPDFMTLNNTEQTEIRRVLHNEGRLSELAAIVDKALSEDEPTTTQPTAQRPPETQPTAFYGQPTQPTASEPLLLRTPFQWETDPTAQRPPETQPTASKPTSKAPAINKKEGKELGERLEKECPSSPWVADYEVVQTRGKVIDFKTTIHKGEIVILIGV